MSAIGFTVRDIDAPLGAEVVGFDFDALLDDDRFATLHRAMLARQALVFRNCAMMPVQQIALARRFGTLPPHYQTSYHDDTHPEIFIITNLDDAGRPIGRNPDPTSSLWHTDGSWQRPRGAYTMLYGIEVPNAGGDTKLANTYLAYERLMPERQTFLEGLTALHDLAWSVDDSNPDYVWPPGQKEAAPRSEQPVVQTHRETGRKAIYLGQHAASIVGMAWDEGRALIAEINAAATWPEYVFCHRWAPRDLLIWDNRCTLHCSTPYDYATERRIVHRTSVQERTA